MVSSAVYHAFRLAPHADLKSSVIAYANEHEITAGVMITCVGSLEQYNIRFANQPEGTKARGFFEILTLTGTFSRSEGHFHISVADSNGQVTGGHLLNENLVYTTAEIVIASLPSFQFVRDVDHTYGYRELVVKKIM